MHETSEEPIAPAEPMLSGADMKMSVGSKMLELFQCQPKGPAKKSNETRIKKVAANGSGRMKNFNFKVNLEEIDKIINEEDEPAAPSES